jgi:hypothetical protein
MNCLPSLLYHPLCPVTAMSSVLVLVGEPLESLFRLSDQSCLTYSVFFNAFSFILQLMRLDQSSYGGHSFRRGAATWGSKVGLSDSDIKLLGYWSSDWFSRYVDSDVDQRLKAISNDQFPFTTIHSYLIILCFIFEPLLVPDIFLFQKFPLGTSRY